MAARTLTRARVRQARAHRTKTRLSARLRAPRRSLTAYMWHWRLRLGEYARPGPNLARRDSSSSCAAVGSTADSSGSGTYAAAASAGGAALRQKPMRSGASAPRLVSTLTLS